MKKQISTRAHKVLTKYLTQEKRSVIVHLEQEKTVSGQQKKAGRKIKRRKAHEYQ